VQRAVTPGRERTRLLRRRAALETATVDAV
jgi:hypothetical protein